LGHSRRHKGERHGNDHSGTLHDDGSVVDGLTTKTKGSQSCTDAIQ
jgi:hypothetical protein